MARRKSQALEVPTSAEDAVTMIEEYVSIERDILSARLSAEREVDAAKARRDDAVAGLEAQRTALYAGLKAWWEAGGAKEVAGRRRSAELAGAKIGIRLTPPAVTFARKVKEAAIVAWLQSLRWTRSAEFLRRGPTKLDKPALIKAAQAEPEIRETFARQGVTVQQVDEFFIDAGLDEDAMRQAVEQTS